MKHSCLLLAMLVLLVFTTGCSSSNRTEVNPPKMEN